MFRKPSVFTDTDPSGLYQWKHNLGRRPYYINYWIDALEFHTTITDPLVILEPLWIFDLLNIRLFLEPNDHDDNFCILPYCMLKVEDFTNKFRNILWDYSSSSYNLSKFESSFFHRGFLKLYIP